MKTLIRVSEYIFRAVFRKMSFLLNSVQIHKNMEAKKKAERISVVFCYRKTIKRTTTEYFNFIDLHTIKDVI